MRTFWCNKHPERWFMRSLQRTCNDFVDKNVVCQVHFTLWYIERYNNRNSRGIKTDLMWPLWNGTCCEIFILLRCVVIALWWFVAGNPFSNFTENMLWKWVGAKKSDFSQKAAMLSHIFHLYDVELSENQYEHSSLKMYPLPKCRGSGSWPITCLSSRRSHAAERDQGTLWINK